MREELRNVSTAACAAFLVEHAAGRVELECRLRYGFVCATSAHDRTRSTSGIPSVIFCRRVCGHRLQFARGRIAGAEQSAGAEVLRLA